MNDDATHQRSSQTGSRVRGEQSSRTWKPQELPREQLSALMDGELSEFETRRLLALLAVDTDFGEDSHGGEDGARALLATWERYHLVRSALRPEPMMASLESSAANSADGTSRLSLSDRINVALANEAGQRTDAEPAHSSRKAKRLPAWTQGAGRVAIAATVALSVFLGMQSLVQDGSGMSAEDSGLVAERGATLVPERQFAVDSDAQQRLNDYIRSVSIPARSEPQAAPYTNLLDSSPLLRPVADRELVVPEPVQAD